MLIGPFLFVMGLLFGYAALAWASYDARAWLTARRTSTVAKAPPAILALVMVGSRFA